MKKTLVVLALLGVAGCASSLGGGPLRAPESAAAAVALPRHQIAAMSVPLNRNDVPLKPMTASQSAARMN